MENWKNSEGCKWTRSDTSFFAPATSWADCDGNTGTAKVTEKNSAWPLKLGHEWSYSVDGGDWETDRNCEVTDTIRVSSMLGEHDAYKVVCGDKWNTRTWYISTKLKRLVYYQRRRRRGGSNVFEPTQ